MNTPVVSFNSLIKLPPFPIIIPAVLLGTKILTCLCLSVSTRPSLPVFGTDSGFSYIFSEIY
ncbi:unnamed protein product [Schistosoma curassoni]|uniref:Uncharacterized protein n=1 Tax=Schistosoma curassoni TaxID=6186 RepID=A0A183JSA4_9TREM|nr:unnamed protein product [Schistosoma curassoni]